jgi:N-acetylmuramic acid 6-phosphate etherase
MVRTSPPTAAGPGDVENPRAALLDTYPADEVVRLLVDEESVAIRAAKAAAPDIARASQLLAERLILNSRLVYVGAGTAGRLAAFEAAECTRLFSVPPSLILSVMAGGPQALGRTVEASQDNRREAEQRMRKAAVGPGDVVCGVADGDVSMFLQTALEYARFRRAHVVLVSCTDPPAAEDGGSLADILIKLDPGPEIITGATRFKAATAIKLALAGFSTAAFVKIGKTYGGLLVDVRPTTPRAWKRAIAIVTRLCRLDAHEAEKLIKKAGGRTKDAVVMHHARVNASRARELLVQHRGSLRAIVGDIDLSG